MVVSTASSLPSNFMFDLSVLDNGNMPFYLMVFFWLLIIIWVIKDSNYRSNSTGFVILSLLLVTLGTPLIGLPIYLAIRPLGYKHERAYWKSVMTQGIEDEEGISQHNEAIDYNAYYAEKYKDYAEKYDDTDTDEDHLELLKKQATVSKRRVTKTTPSTTKKNNTSSAKPKTTTSSAPKAKKPTPRSSK